MTQQRTQVLVVGAGPVGLTLAIDLKQRGVEVEVIEQQTNPRVLPKMERCNARTMEIFRRLGISERIRAASQFTPIPMDVFVSTSVADPPMLHLEYPSSIEAIELSKNCKDGTLPLEPYQLISQYTLEPLLREVAIALGIPIRLGWKLESFQQDATCVTSTIAIHDGTSAQIKSAYLVGCDGGVSGTRKALGFALEGDGRIARMLQIFFRSDDLFEKFPYGKGRHVYTHNGSLVVQDDLKHFMINVFDFDDSSDPVDLVRKVIGLPVDIEILAANPWWLHLLAADHYQRDRVLLAGDAVHLVIPQGGLGMNTGIGDAYDLGWKLAGALAGWGGPNLLESYELERRPIGIRNREASRAATRGLRLWLDACTPDMADDTPEAAAVRAHVTELAREGQRIGHEMSGIELGYRYDGSPIVCGEVGDAPDADAMRYTPSTWPGTRLPSVWMSDGTALFDRIGSDFTLLCLDGRSTDTRSVEKAAVDLGMTLDVLTIDDPAIRSVYGADFLLTRPDLHVAWRGNELPDDAMTVLSTATGNSITV